MKIRQDTYKRFLDLFIKEVPVKKMYHGENEFLDKLVNSKDPKTVKRPNMKTIGALLLAPAIIAGGVSYAKKDSEPIIAPPSVTTSQEQTAIAPLPYDDNTYMANYRGVPYKFLKEEYVLSLAAESLDRVQLMLSSVDGLTPVGTNNGNFYPDYFNPYLLTALCYTESSYRISDADGKLCESSAGALGLTQVKPKTIDSLNNWLHNTLNLKNINYSVEDLQNPEKAMDITTLILIQICKNHGKVGCNNPIYPYLTEGFSLRRQEEIILAIYNNGYDNMRNYIENGTIYNYLREGSPSNYVNKILSKKESLQENYIINE